MNPFESIGQWGGLGISYLFIFGLIGIAQLLLRQGILGASATRKVVHIGVAHWWIIAMLFIDDLTVALIGPVSFVIINWLSYRKHIFAAMEHPEPRKNLGTVYFPLALVALVLLTWSGLFPQWFGLVAILVLGWGDGSASLVGEHVASRTGAGRFVVPGGKKSIAGTTAMFTATVLVSLVVIVFFAGLPWSADNDTGSVPVATASSGTGLFARVATFAAAGSWVAKPTDSSVLVALSRLDSLARIATSHAAEIGDEVVRAAGPRIEALTSQAVSALGPVSWQLAPSTILAIAFILAAVATAVELLTPWGLDNLSLPLIVFFTLAALVAMPEVWVVRLAWALGLNILIAVAAYLKSSVTATGALAGAAVGLVIFLSGGGFYWAILMAFFISSSVLSRIKSRGSGAEALRRRDARRAAEAINAKGSRRDGVQVLANGGLAALMAAAHAYSGRPIFMLGFAIALAAANADTWASEIGVMSRREPLSILTWHTIPRGTSGGISTLGLLASAGGSLFIALCFGVGYWLTYGWNGGEMLAMVAAITGGGFLGSLIDSFLGATVQAQYWDHNQQKYTERRHGAAGSANRLVRGSHLFTNDAVNALSGIMAMTVLFSIVS